MIVAIKHKADLKRKYVLKYIKTEDKKAPYQQQIISEYYLVGYTQILAGH